MSAVGYSRRGPRRAGCTRLRRRRYFGLNNCVNVVVAKNDIPTKLTSEIIIAAILGFGEQKRQIDSRIIELKAMFSGGPVEATATPLASKRKRRKMSAAGRARK